MTPTVEWWDAHLLCWDQALIDDALSGRLWGGGHQLEHRVGGVGQTQDTGSVLVVPARYHSADDVLAHIRRWPASVVLATSDEEGTFDWRRVHGRASYLWVQSAMPAAPDRNLIVGYPTATPELVERAGYGPRALDWFFAGQITHERREQCVAQLHRLDGGHLIETEAFTDGIDRAAYLEYTSRAKAVPCPSGPVGTDTFRVWEALEAGAVPIADGRSPAMPPGYWDRLGALPFPTVGDWRELPEALEVVLGGWPHTANVCSAWWQQYKRNLHWQLHDDISAATHVAPPSERPEVTVLVPTSPIPSHPALDMLERTLTTVWDELGAVDVIVMCDGVRAAQEHRREAYEEYVRRLCWATEHHWRNVLPLIFDQCTHQAEMTRVALDHVRTRHLLYVEHDTPLASWNGATEWGLLQAALDSGEANIIRLHHEANILEPHRHMMLDEAPQLVAGAPLLRTVQWSQRPHLARTGFYRWMLDRFFSERRPTMIEDVMHGAVHNEWHDYGLAGWDRFRLWLYAPPGSMQRSYHLDGRDGDPKYAGA